MKNQIIKHTAFLVIIFLANFDLFAQQEVHEKWELYGHLIRSASIPMHIGYDQVIERCDDYASTKNDTIEFVDVAREDGDSNFSCIGRDYYNSLIEDSLERNAFFSLAFYVDFTNRAFDACGNSTSLGSGLLGSPTIGDIFLIARLSAQGLLHIYSPGNTPKDPQFGDPQSQQYLNYIASTKVNFQSFQRSFNADLTGMYRFALPCYDSASITAGFILPFKYAQAALDFTLAGGKLYQPGYAAMQTTIRETTITQFYKDFVSIEDFFIRAVLQPKGIYINGSQSTAGVGDLTLFAILDIAECWDYVDGFQFGFNLILPTAPKGNSSSLISTSLGNGGGFLIDIFSNIIYRTCYDNVNPTLEIGAEFGVNKFSTTRRVPQIKTQSAEGPLRNNPTLIVPVFREYRTNPFSEIDSLNPFFADNVFSVSVRNGYKMFAGIGNYFYNAFSTKSTVGIFYQYLRRGEDKIFGLPSNALGALVTGPTKSEAHKISWNWMFNTSAGFEIMFGSEHIVAGKNVAKLNDLFLTLNVVF